MFNNGGPLPPRKYVNSVTCEEHRNNNTYQYFSIPLILVDLKDVEDVFLKK